MLKKFKVCVVTGSRAEYGLLYYFLKELKIDKKIDLKLIVTGSHLSHKFGFTIKEIKKDKFKVDKEIKILSSSDTPYAISKSTALGLVGFGQTFKEIKPDLLVLLGDRYEILAAAISANFARIPIAHIHGGESTEGAFDETIRHSITKMSHIHFVSTKDYQKRVIQLGENPSTVHLVGGFGIDYIKKTKLLKINKVEKFLNTKFLYKNLIVTFHPVTYDINMSSAQIDNLLQALNNLKDTRIIFTGSNADTEGKIINIKIKKYVKKNKNSIFIMNMGSINYLSTLQFVDGIIGNSSSGLLEAPSFKIGTINIGDRQKGRVKAKSVINCNYEVSSISKALKKLYSKSFKKVLKNVRNPYDQNKFASKETLKVIKEKISSNMIKKKFYDIRF